MSEIIEVIVQESPQSIEIQVLDTPIVEVVVLNMRGEKGDKGDTGDQGIQGIQGEKGDKGDTGDQGIQGIQGVKGDKGDPGDQGIQGIQGVKGDKGDTGNNGTPGAYPYTGLPKFVPTPVSLTETKKKGQWSYDTDFLYFWVGDSVVAKVPRITGTKIPLVVAIPANSSSSGYPGQMAFDTTNNFVYFCIATNTWRRASLTLSTF